MFPIGKYTKRDSEIYEIDKSDNKSYYLWTISGNCENENGNADDLKEKEYSYDEAMEIAGTGWYTIGLTASLSLVQMAMCVDIFSFSTIVALSSCDFYLTNMQTHVLMAMPFLGPIMTANAWGYISDTQGRRRSLFVAMLASFITSTLSAFSPNWIALAVFKLIGTCFSSCAQSSTYALLGESCADRLKGKYMLVMTSVIHISMGMYFAVAYFIGFLEFSYDLEYITFVPWRLLILLLAMPLGLSAVCLMFFYESPKFLINVGKGDQALTVLSQICRRNRGVCYPVKKVALREVGNVKSRSESFWVSLWQQTAPLFTPPLLPKTVLLYCLIFIVYSSSSCLFVWLPFLASDFTKAVSSTSNQHQGICFVVTQVEQSSSADEIECTPRIHLPIVIFTMSVGFIYCALNIIMSRLASKKKTLMIAIFVFSSGCCLGALHIPSNITNIILFFGIIADALCIGLVFSYCVEFYPTSFRGMGACLSVMVARLSSIFGVNLIGTYITWHCHRAFYALTGLIFSGAILSCLLPADSVKKL